MERKIYKYGKLSYANPKVGDFVRLIESPGSRTATILRANAPHEITAVLLDVKGEMGYVEVKPPSRFSSVAEVGSASALTVEIPISARGSLRVK